MADSIRPLVYDSSLASKPHVRAVLVSGLKSQSSLSENLASFVGAGMLAGTIERVDGAEEQWRQLKAHLGISELAPAAATEAVEGDCVSNREVCEIYPKSLHGSAAFETVLSASETETLRALEVNDVIASHEDNQHQQQDRGGAGILLVLKICGALADMGYDTQTVISVGKLVVKNCMTAWVPVTEEEEAERTSHEASTPVEEEEDEEEDTSTTLSNHVRDALKQLLDRSVQRSRTVHMNSNEPILLINGRGIGNFPFHEVIDETIRQLHDHWSIWPVRIYAGQYLGNEHENEPAPGFSITLLNVTNTDIGGPSMVQLLDAPCEAKGWNGDFVRREIWDSNRNLLAREINETEEVKGMMDSGIGIGSEERNSPASHEPDLPPAEHTPQKQEKTEKDVEVEAVDHAELATELEERESHENVLQQHDENDNERKTLQPLAPPSSQSPKMTTPISEREADVGDFEQIQGQEDTAIDDDEDEGASNRTPATPPLPERHIQHPSWSRDHEQTSLLDLIRMQASRLEGSTATATTAAADDDKEVGKKSGVVGAGEEEDEEDGFQLVNANK